jgi:hypothetical protein
MKDKLPRHIVWSTDQVDLDDPFQRRWWLQQVLINGLTEDIQHLDFDEIARELDQLKLPEDIRRLWQAYFKSANSRGSNAQR